MPLRLQKARYLLFYPVVQNHGLRWSNAVLARLHKHDSPFADKVAILDPRMYKEHLARWCSWSDHQLGTKICRFLSQESVENEY